MVEQNDVIDALPPWNFFNETSFDEANFILTLKTLQIFIYDK